MLAHHLTYLIACFGALAAAKPTHTTTAIWQLASLASLRSSQELAQASREAHSEFTSQIANLAIFLPPDFAYGKYGASVVDACSGYVTYAIQCTEATRTILPIIPVTASTTTTAPASARCGPNAPIMNVTQGDNVVAFSTHTPSGSATVSVYESCHISDLRAAVCYAAKTVFRGGTPIRTTTATETVDAINFIKNTYAACFSNFFVLR